MVSNKKKREKALFRLVIMQARLIDALCRYEIRESGREGDCYDEGGPAPPDEQKDHRSKIVPLQPDFHKLYR